MQCRASQPIGDSSIALSFVLIVTRQPLGRDEFQGHAVDAVTQAGRLRAIVEHVPEMPAATAAMHFLPDHAERVVGVGLHRAVDRSVEARPARSRVELGLGGKQRQIAARASEGAFAVLVVERAGERTFCVLLTQYGVLLRREQLPPFLRSVGDLERLGGGVRAAAPPQAGKAGGSQSGETEGPQSN